MNPNSALDDNEDRDDDGFSNAVAYTYGWSFDAAIYSSDDDFDSINDVVEAHWVEVYPVLQVAGSWTGDLDPMADIDGDDVLTGEELLFRLNPTLSETSTGTPDWDTFSDAFDLRYGFQPIQCPAGDVDGDGLPDSWEHFYWYFDFYFWMAHRDPLNSLDDPDGDQLTNLQEFLHNTDPWNYDTDGDGDDDGTEVANGTDPNVNLATVDTDGDGVTDLQEIADGTDPETSEQPSPGFQPTEWAEAIKSLGAIASTLECEVWNKIGSTSLVGFHGGSAEYSGGYNEGTNTKSFGNDFLTPRSELQTFFSSLPTGPLGTSLRAADQVLPLSQLANAAIAETYWYDDPATVGMQAGPLTTLTYSDFEARNRILGRHRTIRILETATNSAFTGKTISFIVASIDDHYVPRSGPVTPLKRPNGTKTGLLTFTFHGVPGYATATLTGELATSSQVSIGTDNCTVYLTPTFTHSSRKTMGLVPAYFKTYPDSIPGPDKAHTRNLTTRQDETTKYGIGWNKVVCKIWNSSPGNINLLDSIDGGPGNHSAYTDLVKWKVNGVEQTSHNLSLGDKPNMEEHTHFNIQVLSKSGTDTLDRLIITVVPPETKSNFDNWYALESTPAGKFWFSECPRMPSSLEISPLQDPDRLFSPRIWRSPGTENTYFHPDAYYEIRAKISSIGSGHQVTFDSTGTPILSGVSAGTADKQAAFPENLTPGPHIDADVKPFMWALQLDGNPCDQDFTTLTLPILYEGSYISKYMECRPPQPNSKPSFSPGGTP